MARGGAGRIYLQRDVGEVLRRGVFDMTEFTTPAGRREQQTS